MSPRRTGSYDPYKVRGRKATGVPAFARKSPLNHNCIYFRVTVWFVALVRGLGPWPFGNWWMDAWPFGSWFERWGWNFLGLVFSIPQTFICKTNLVLNSFFFQCMLLQSLHKSYLYMGHVRISVLQVLPVFTPVTRRNFVNSSRLGLGNSAN